MRTYILLISGLILGTLSGCKKLVEIDPPKNLINTQAVFRDSANAESAILGILISMQNMSTTTSFGNSALTLYPGMSADELYPTQNAVAENMQIYFNSINPVTNGATESMWNQAYALIYKANACIEGLQNSSTLPAGLRQRLTGEAKFYRSFFYFYLINLYGAVPYVESTDYHRNAKLGRTSADTIYQHIITDLLEAKTYLSPISAGRNRASQMSASALLARVYLFQKNWTAATLEASQVIDNPDISLEQDLSHVFLSGSKEAIWQMLPLQEGYETTEGLFFVPSSRSVLPLYVVNPHLLGQFKDGDLRKLNWLDSSVVNNLPYYYPYKYKLGYDGNTSPVENYMVIRLAEVLLIRSEAGARLNKLDQAADDLNLIRLRAGIQPYTGNSQTDLLNAILKERQLELFAEWGHRWFDLKRNGLANEVLEPIKNPNWQTTDQLYPIPITQLNLNSSLTQNLGYN